MWVGIVGARARQDRSTVEAVVAELPDGTTVVSGGCRGVDSWAAEAAERRGLAVIVLRPDLDGARSYGEIAGRYHDRNQRLVDMVDRLIALPRRPRSRKGGTEDTIRRAARRKIPVEIR